MSFYEIAFFATYIVSAIVTALFARKGSGPMTTLDTILILCPGANTLLALWCLFILIAESTQ